MPSIATNIRIDAPPNKVWEVLMGFERYPEWNPFLVSVSGEKQVDSKLHVEFKGGMTMTPTILTCTPNSHFAWRGRLLDLPFLFTGDHHFALSAVDGENGTEFVNFEDFSGILAWVLQFVGGLYRDTEANFRRMNEALKERVEGGSSS